VQDGVGSEETETGTRVAEVGVSAMGSFVEGRGTEKREGNFVVGVTKVVVLGEGRGIEKVGAARDQLLHLGRVL
jgi:hypothetical protein